MTFAPPLVRRALSSLPEQGVRAQQRQDGAKRAGGGSAEGPGSEGPGGGHRHNAPESTTAVPKLGHVAALDGLRGLAFLTVLAYHLRPGQLPGAGYIGVDVFFGLSGFLVTTLLIQRLGPAARHRGRRLERAVADFYARRGRRLLPALVCFLAVYCLVRAVAGHASWFDGVPAQTWSSPPVTWADMAHTVVGVLGYFSNLAITFGWSWQGAPIGHLWSLAVEGQFYVGWGLLLAAVLVAVRGRRRAALWVSGALAVGLAAWSVAATALVWHAGAGGHYAYFATWTRAQSLLLGAAAGVWWCSGSAHRAVRTLTGRALAALAVLASAGWLVAATVVLPATGPAVPAVSDLAAVSAACAVLVLLVALRPRSIGARLCRLSPLRSVGRRSYALYLWHYPLLAWFRGHGAAGDALAIALAFAAAELSWRLVEHPVQASGRLLPFLHRPLLLPFLDRPQPRPRPDEPAGDRRRGRADAPVRVPSDRARLAHPQVHLPTLGSR
jgi:peptidoglycan/LPS O-acetylase OafA/YrhL